MKLIVKRVYNNHVSVRDYLVDKAIDRNQPITVELRVSESKDPEMFKIWGSDEGKTMHIPVEKLRGARSRFHDRQWKSQYKSKQEYQLIDFLWVPDEKDENSPKPDGAGFIQPNLFD